MRKIAAVICFVCIGFTAFCDEVVILNSKESYEEAFCLGRLAVELAALKVPVRFTNNPAEADVIVDSAKYVSLFQRNDLKATYPLRDHWPTRVLGVNPDKKITLKYSDGETTEALLLNVIYNLTAPHGRYNAEYYTYAMLTREQLLNFKLQMEEKLGIKGFYE